MGVPIFMLLLIAFLFAPTWWHCLCFGFYLLFFQVIGTAALLELDSSLVWSALEPRGLVTTWANPALLALALTLWCLAGGKFKWNGPSSLKSFYVVSCAVLSIPPLYFYLYFAGSAVQQAQWWMWVGLSCAELSAFVAPIFLVVGMLVTFVSRRGTTVRADGGSS